MKTRLIALISLLLASLPVAAQISSASLTGLITDSSGAVVPSAKVTARSKSTNFERMTQTDQAGYYFFALLPVGNYDVTVQVTGFQPAEQTVTLETAQKAAPTSR